MPEDKKHKRPEFKPPFPVPSIATDSSDVLTNDTEETADPIVVETVAEDTPSNPADNPNDDKVSDVFTEEKETMPEPEPEKTKPEPQVSTIPNDRETSHSDVSSQALHEGGPKFVSKNATTLTREPVTDFLKTSPPKTSAPLHFAPLTSATPQPHNTSPTVKEIHATSRPEFRPSSATTPSPTLVAPSPKPATSKDSSGSLFTTGIIIFSLIFGLAGWTLYFNTKFNFLKTPALTPTEESQPITSPTPSATPTPINNRAAITLEVLNGSGVAGMAAKTADRLQTLGYTVIATGNADRSNYATSQVLVSPAFDTSELLIADLTKAFNIANVSGELKDSTASARIIVGKDWIK